MAKKPSIKKEFKTFSSALKKGTLPNNAVTRGLKKYFGVKGNPLKRELRSKKAREEFNRLLTQYNKERMTQEKEARKREAIRKKQVETRKKNVLPKQAEKAARKYEKILDIIQAVSDEIGSYISYQEAEELIQDNPRVESEKISRFIIDKYKEMQDRLPDFAKDKSSLKGLITELQKTMDEIGSNNIDDLSKALMLKSTNPALYARQYKRGRR